MWWNREGKQTEAISKSEHYLFPALSRDGTRVAAGIFAGGQGVMDVWIFDLTRQTSTRLTFGPGTQGNPVWSSDGMTIFYGSNTTGLSHIYAKAADGGGAEHLILDEGTVSEAPRSVSLDGRYLVFERRQPNESGYHLWVLPLQGDQKPFPIVQDVFDEELASVSPDGRWMAYQSNESGRREVYVTGFPGGGAKWQVSSNGGSSPKWRADGKELFFLDTSDTLSAVDFSTRGGAPHLGAPRALFQAVGIQRDFGAYDVTADGEKFLLNSGNLKEGSDPLTLVLNWAAELKR
jgi:eukaryotic-like serine/threonine-protein kinase